MGALQRRQRSTTGSSFRGCTGPTLGAGPDDAGLLFGLRRSLFARRVQQVLDAEDALNVAGLGCELLRHVRLDLAAKVDDTILRVDVDLPLRDLRVAEDLRFDLACEGHVVRL